MAAPFASLDRRLTVRYDDREPTGVQLASAPARHPRSELPRSAVALVWGPGDDTPRARLEAATRQDPDRPECRRLRAALALLDELCGPLRPVQPA